MISFKQFLKESWLPSEVLQNFKGKKCILTDTSGMTLYIFDSDKEPSVSTCYGDCAIKWPPLRAINLSNDIDDSSVEYSHDDWTLVRRSDGITQWAYKGKPLYNWYKDKKPGDDVTGEKIKGWHIAYFTDRVTKEN